MSAPAPTSFPAARPRVRAPAPARREALVREALRAAEARLAAVGCATARLDAELLVADALVVDRTALYFAPERPVAEDAARRLESHLARREAREPVAYILGRRTFRRLELRVDPRVLIPRPETELLVEVALAEAPRSGHVHDVGTGSGAVALALADERPDLRVTASDASAAALAVARENAARLGLDVELLLGRGLPEAAGAPDLVVANLPYVREDELACLEPEITHWEPREALVGGSADGLVVVRETVARLPRGARVALEHAPAQARAVRQLLTAARSVRGPGGPLDVTVGWAP